MDDQQKRIAFAAVFVLAVIILGYALYRVFFKSKLAPVSPPGIVEPVSPGGLPQAGTGTTTGRTPGTGVAPLPVSPGTPTPVPVGGRTTDTPREEKIVIDPALGTTKVSGGGVHFYNKTNGQFYRALPNGTLAALSDQVFYNVQDVAWSSKTNESIMEYPDGSNIYYNFDTKRQVTLPKQWTDFAFSPGGEKIIAKSIGYSEENRFLVTANPDGTGVTAVLPLGANADKVIVDWSPNRQIVGIARTGDQLGADRQEVLFLGERNENFPSTIVEGRGLETKWSPQGNKLLYSVYSGRSDFKPELWVVDGNIESLGENRSALNINTWASKCSFQSERFLYCGVPTELETGAGLAPAIASTVPDRLVRIDIQTGIQTEITLEETHTIDTITVNETENAVYFTDKNQDGIFRVSL